MMFFNKLKIFINLLQNTQDYFINKPFSKLKSIYMLTFHVDSDFGGVLWQL